MLQELLGNKKIINYLWIHLLTGSANRSTYENPNFFTLNDIHCKSTCFKLPYSDCSSLADPTLKVSFFIFTTREEGRCMFNPGLKV